MKILSIDVGIINLAYCLIEIKDNKYKILYWDTINLCSETYICKEKLKKKICNREAKYTKNNIYYCRSCAKKSNFIIPSNTFKKIHQKRTKIDELKQIANEYEIKLKENSKKQDIVDSITNYLKDKYLDVIEKASASNVSLIDIGIELNKKLSNELFTSVDKVIIENQISPIANRMKTIQGMIAQFFIMNDIKDIEFVSASNKLKKFITTKTTYSERKKLGIKITLDIITNENYLNEWAEHFNTHKKKDDLADSFLQALWYINQYHNIEQYNKK